MPKEVSLNNAHDLDLDQINLEPAPPEAVAVAETAAAAVDKSVADAENTVMPLPDRLHPVFGQNGRGRRSSSIL